MPLESAARRRKENAAAERRKARRPASWAGDLRALPEDRSARETDHRVRRSAPAPVGVLLPSIFRASGKQTRGTRPLPTGPAQRWLFAAALPKNPETPNSNRGQHGQIRDIRTF